MRMLLTATFLTVAAAAPAFAEPVERSFEHDGVTYTYTEDVRADRTILEGRAMPGSRFRLVVRNGRVSGYSGLTRVNFELEEAYHTAERIALSDD